MAGLMTAPIILIELPVMRSTYENRRLNALVGGLASSRWSSSLLMIRQQTAITDEQFLKSMIPHHASAILMCEKAKIQDPEIRALCETIMKGQQAEIDQMKRKLASLD